MIIDCRVKKFGQAAALAGCLILAASSGYAATPKSAHHGHAAKPAPVAETAPVAEQPAYRGFQAGDMMLRLRGALVDPETNSNTSIGGHVEGSTSAVPEVDFTYYFTPNVAVEAIAATTPHHMMAKGTSVGDVDLGNVWLLPPTVTLQYHFMPTSTINPYLGAGVNYTVFYAQETASGSPVTKINYSNGFGAAIQAGVDINVKDNWYVNFDVKHIFISTDVNMNGGAITANVDVDPTIVGFGFGYRF